MRATDLSFRSPKERTPDAYFPQMTADGRVLAFSPRQTRGGVIGNELRFREYDQHYRKTGFRVGPGSYDTEQDTISRSPIKGSFLYKPLHKDTSHNGYIMVGNHMVYEGHLVSPGRRRDLKVKDPDCRVDVEFALSQTAVESGCSRNSSERLRPRTEGVANSEDRYHRDTHHAFRSAKSMTRRSFTQKNKKAEFTLHVKDKKIRKMLDDRLSVPL